MAGGFSIEENKIEEFKDFIIKKFYKIKKIYLKQILYFSIQKFHHLH